MFILLIFSKLVILKLFAISLLVMLLIVLELGLLSLKLVVESFMANFLDAPLQDAIKPCLVIPQLSYLVAPRQVGPPLLRALLQILPRYSRFPSF